MFKIQVRSKENEREEEKNKIFSLMILNDVNDSVNQ